VIILSHIYRLSESSKINFIGFTLSLIPGYHYEIAHFPKQTLVLLPLHFVLNFKQFTLREIKGNFNHMSDILGGGQLCNKFVLDRYFLTYVRFEIFTEVSMKNAVTWDVAP
jgi:hypothetical protein